MQTRRCSTWRKADGRSRRSAAWAKMRRAIWFGLLGTLASCDQCGTDPVPFDVSVEITDSPDPVVVDGAITYTVVVTNTGPARAGNFRVSLTYSGPAILSALPVGPTPGSCPGISTATRVTCQVDDLGVSRVAEFAITARATSVPSQVSLTAELHRVNDDGQKIDLGDDDDSNDTATEMTTVVAAFAITTHTTPNTGAGQPYDFDIAVTGVTGQQVVYSLESGTLPPGIQLNTSSGKLSGTPTQGGRYPFQIRAVNVGPPLQVSIRSYEIIVVEIQTSQLPDGVVGEFYAAAIGTRNAIAANWSITSVALDEGLPPGIPYPTDVVSKTVIGLSGTPTLAGTYRFTVTATEATQGAQHQKRLSITVIEPDHEPPTASFVFNCTFLNCTGDATASTAAPGHAITSYGWDFGDGTTGSGSTVNTQYQSPGTYTVTLTVTDDGGATGTASQQFVVSAPPAGGQVAVTTNAGGLFVFGLGVDGTPLLQTIVNPAEHQGPGEVRAQPQPNAPGQAGAGAAGVGAATGPTPSLFVSYIGSKDVVRWNVTPAGGLTKAAEFDFAEAPFQIGANPQGTCVAVPLQSAARIQSLTADLVATSQLTIAAGFPTQVLFHPANATAYAQDGTKLHVLNANATNCSLTDMGNPLTFANLRAARMDPAGGFLQVLTFNPFGGATAMVLQRLTNGLPSGAPVSTPLPAASFFFEPHPTLDVLYVLQDAPASGIRKLTFDRATGAVTVGNVVSVPAPDEITFNADASRLYYLDVSTPSLARICWFDLNAQGDLLGTRTCSSDPARGIDSDLLIITRPTAAPAARVRR